MTSHSGNERATQKGRLFVFEGPNGVGKTSIVAAAAEILRETVSAQVEIESFPGKRPGTLGSLVYALHHDHSAFGIDQISPDSLQLLHVAAHLDTIDGTIRGALLDGAVILLDRFWWSTLVYGRLSGANEQTLQRAVQLERAHWGELRPDAVFLVCRNSNKEMQTEAAAYQAIAEEMAARCKVIILENNSSISDAAARVVAQVHASLRDQRKAD